MIVVERLCEIVVFICVRFKIERYVLCDFMWILFFIVLILFGDFSKKKRKK